MKDKYKNGEFEAKSILEAKGIKFEHLYLDVTHTHKAEVTSGKVGEIINVYEKYIFMC